MSVTGNIATITEVTRKEFTKYMKYQMETQTTFRVCEAVAEIRNGFRKKFISLYNLFVFVELSGKRQKLRKDCISGYSSKVLRRTIRSPSVTDGT